MNTLTAPVEQAAHGISVVDTGFVRPQFDAAYLIVEGQDAAFVDTGTNDAVPRLLQALRAQNLDPADVRWLVLTHVHLDHAGGAGLLMQHLPNARLLVHPRGARHMANPSALAAGVRAVYGEALARRNYGELLPVPAERIVATHDGMVVQLGPRPLRVLDTPGHARHHNAIWDEASGGCFVGDTLGVSYLELRPGTRHYALPSTTPVQFDPQALKSSVARLLALQPRVAFITHYGAIEQVQAQAEMVLQQAEAMVALAQSPAGHDPAALRRGLFALYRERAQARGLQLEDAALAALIGGDVDLNAQGLEAWRQQ